MVEIKKLPPGVAAGAGDLHRWASRRMAGKSGVPDKKLEEFDQVRIVRCRACGFETRLLVGKGRRFDRRCRNCGRKRVRA